ncbi:hypothetical protein evm_015047 [Chilo suppressalis]|nr:hypothetical protein evm_015047 [Chilo suppressalis]
MQSVQVYSKEAIRDIVKYGLERGVRVLPEFDAPAHVGEGWQDTNLTVCFKAEPWRSYCVEPPCGQLNPTKDELYDYLGDIYADMAGKRASSLPHNKWSLLPMDTCSTKGHSGVALFKYHHHQSINVPTAGAQAFPMDEIGRLGHDPPRGPSADWRVLTTADAAGTNGLTCLPKHGGTRDRCFWSPIQ